MKREQLAPCDSQTDQDRGGLILGSSPAGFALIELLFVVAILLLLTTMYWRSGSDNRQQRLQADCQRNLQKIFVALQIYANEHAAKFPEIPGARTSEQPLDLLVPHYTVDTAIFICPASKDSPLPAGESFRNRKISYAYYMGRRSTNTQQVLMSDRQVNALSKAAGEAVFSTNGKAPGNNHEQSGGNFLFCDGHAEQSPAQAPFSLELPEGVVLLNPK